MKHISMCVSICINGKRQNVRVLQKPKQKRPKN